MYTASEGDFSLAPGELTFTASDSSTYQMCSVVTATSDIIFEDDETFTVTLNPDSLPSGVTISGGSSTTVTISANGGPWNLFERVYNLYIIIYIGVMIQMSVVPERVTEGEMVMICVTLTGQLERNVVVSLTSTIGTGKYIRIIIIGYIIIHHDNYLASSEDFILAPGGLMFTPLSTNEKCSVVMTTSDDIFEDDETFTVTLNPNSLPSGVTISGGSSTTVIIPANGGQ